MPKYAVEGVENMNIKGTLKSFGIYLNGLIDKGYVEDIGVIEKEMAQENIAHYLAAKYEREIPLNDINDIDKAEVNRLYASWSGYIEGFECRRFFVKKNGLILLSSLCMELLYDQDLD
ncbi:hypothetical protein Dred_2031 [Desulforamulus reducens MI-1]|uniref:Uncharacterized protein n=1 Tax=Desulforamulus reducens (strain ATCC BAA-1160 / DSM 100696 / MI-1) TaxID=349161 RepID=A4J645_DESRM|nr:hypothetical protein Dred_2031 [Desulforamulus reducens MI-1]